MSDEKKLPLVTVIVPTIGRPAFIVDTIRSILAQTYTNIEVLISDNVPSEPTADLLIAADIRDTRIKILRQTARLEFSAHMNKCLAEALGTYVIIVSDDDQISSNYIANMVRLMESDMDIKVCMGKQIQINEHDRGLQQQDQLSDQIQIIEGLDFLTGTLDRTLNTGLLTYISMFVRRQEILSIGGFKSYPDGSHADNFIIFSLALTGKVAISSSLMFYRIYLASSGLRTPFSALLEATEAYTRDTRIALRGANIAVERRNRLQALVHAANSRMLFSRIRNVYRHSQGPLALIAFVAHALQFKWKRNFL
jgi:glycosyltransferase involved in cell wall biosynthesis